MTVTSSSVSSLNSAILCQELSKRLRAFGVLAASCVLTAGLLVGFGAKAVGQAAHFSGAGTIIGKGTFDGPSGVAIDKNGNMFVAEYDGTDLYEVFAVNGVIPPSPVITRLATFPDTIFGVAVDGSGNAFVTGYSNIYKVIAVNGVIPVSPSIQSIGSGFSVPSGIAVDTNENIFVADTFNNAIKEIVAVNGIIPPSPTIRILGSGFHSPQGVAVDSTGNVYVADTYNKAVKEIVAVNGVVPVSPVINTLVSGSILPWDLALDGSGNIFVTDNGTNQIKEILAFNGVIPTSPTVQTIYSPSDLYDPAGIAVDSAGDVYVAFLSNGVVFESSRSLQDFGDVNLAATSASIALPFTFDSPGTLGSTAVLTQGTAGLDFANNGTGTCAANTSYMTGQTCTVNVAFTPQFAGTRFGAAVLKNTSGAVIATGYVQGTGVGPQVDFLPGRQSTIATAPGWTYGVAVDAKGNVFFADNHNGIIYSASPSGGSYSLSTIPTSSLSGPYGLTVDGSGSLYIVDTGNYRVLKETPSAGSYMESTIASFPANGGTAPTGVAVDGSGNVFIVNAVGTLYKETLTAGSYSQSTIPTGVSSAAGVAVDGGGNVFVAINSTDGEILKETPSAGGYVQSVIAVPSGGVPSGVSVDAVGNLYVNYTVTGAPSQLLKETPSAGGYVQTTIPITGLDQPFGVTVDALGNVYIADSAHQRILKLDFADPPNLTFASTAVGSISSDSPQAVTVENIGNADLSFPIPSTGNNPSVATDFTLDSSGDSACPLVGGGSPEPGALAGAASCELSISFTPAVAGTVSGSLVLTDNNLNAAAPGYAAQSIELSGTGTAATPIITWAPPAAITYGTALSTSQLNATASVAGTFTFNPALGTVPPAGTDTLTVTFTPTDSTDYTTASASVSLTVGKATPMITWPTPAPITYGTALSAMQLNATANVPGTLAYSPALGAVVPAGSQILSVVFTPTDTNDYYTASKTVPLTVNKAILIITWHAPAPITYGAALSATQLNATAGVAGTFTYSPALGTVPPAGTDTLTVTFTPTDSTDYTTASASVSLTVGKATPMITWPTPAPITYGTALSATQLNASANVPGSFAYNPAAGTIPPAGTDTLTVTFTPADTKDYATVTASVSLTVSKPTPSFTLSALSASLSVAQNSSGSSTISVTDVGGFTGSVKLSASGMPSGVTASFGTNPTAKTSVLTLKASAKAATGAVSITITGTSGSLTRTTSIALTVVSHK